MPKKQRLVPNDRPPAAQEPHELEWLRKSFSFSVGPFASEEKADKYRAVINTYTVVQIVRAIRRIDVIEKRLSEEGFRIDTRYGNSSLLFIYFPELILECSHVKIVRVLHSNDLIRSQSRHVPKPWKVRKFEFLDEPSRAV